MRAACFLAVACSRLGLVHEQLLQQVAVTGMWRASQHDAAAGD
jgi:hypothetical protein